MSQSREPRRWTEDVRDTLASKGFSKADCDLIFEVVNESALSVEASAYEQLREALEPFAAIFERYEQVHDLDANEVVVPYVALFNAHKQLEAARAALSVGGGGAGEAAKGEAYAKAHDPMNNPPDPAVAASAYEQLREALERVQRYACSYSGVMIDYEAGDWVRFNDVRTALSVGGGGVGATLDDDDDDLPPHEQTYP